MNFIAHAPEHELVDHLTAVAQGAAAAVDTASAPWAHLAGLWHDLGKFRPGFQSYVRQDGEPGRQVGWLLAHLIAAHHAGLYDAAELQERLIGGTRADSEREHQEAVAACASHAPELLALPEALDAKALLPGIPGLREREPLAQSLWLRMLFSALVDADFLDTEAYLNRGRAEARAGFLRWPTI